MSFFNHLAAEHSDQTEAGRLIVAASKSMAYAEANAADATGITAMTKADAVKFVLFGLGITTKQDLAQAGGSSIAARIMSELSEVDRVAVQSLLS